MGWTFGPKPADEDQECRDAWRGEHIEVIASKMCGGNSSGYSAVWFAAIRISDPKYPTPYIIGAVTLIQRRGQPGYPWGTKEMDETVGPCEVHCPLSIFNRLTPLNEIEKITGRNYEYARGWRENVIAYHAKPKPAALEVGKVYVAPAPLSFSDRVTCDRFMLVENGRRQRWVRMTDKMRVRLSRSVARELKVEVAA